MNPSHYPSLELCKRLTLARFPATEKGFPHNSGPEYYIMPSIAELLDELPRSIGENGLEIVFATCNGESDNGVIIRYKFIHVVHNNTLSNALALMYLWLKENNHLSK